jgi:drug/metabolite transporter (DMT)-like permease
MLLIGLLGTLGHFFLIMSYSRSPAATLTPYMYVQIGFATVGGWLVFGHVPDHITLWGMAVVGISGALGAWLTLKESRVPVTLPES